MQIDWEQVSKAAISKLTSLSLFYRLGYQDGRNDAFREATSLIYQALLESKS